MVGEDGLMWPRASAADSGGLPCPSGAPSGCQPRVTRADADQALYGPARRLVGALGRGARLAWAEAISAPSSVGHHETMRPVRGRPRVVLAKTGGKCMRSLDLYRGLADGEALKRGKSSCPRVLRLGASDGGVRWEDLPDGRPRNPASGEERFYLFRYFAEASSNTRIV